MRPATAAMSLTDAQREVLDKLARSRVAAYGDVQRARALLLAGDGVANTQIAATVDASPTSVKAWRERFVVEGLASLGGVRPGRGRKPKISPEQVSEIVERDSDHAEHAARRAAEALGLEDDTDPEQQPETPAH